MKHKYISLKRNSLGLLQGGHFMFQERCYGNMFNKPTDMREREIDVADIKYLAGPTYMSVMVNEKMNKRVYLVSDIHVSTPTNFDCGINDELSTIYLPDYLNKLFKENRNDVFDLFIELPYTFTKQIKPVYGDLIGNTAFLFGECFRNLSDKTECAKIAPNVRFHAMDIRWYSDDPTVGTDEIRDATSFKINVVSPAIDHEPELIAAERNIDYLISKYTGQPDKQEIIDKLTEINLVHKHDSLMKINQIKQLYNGNDFELDEIMNEVKLTLSHYISNDPTYIEFIRKYIGDENGLYDDSIERFWKLVYSSVKLSRSLTIDQDVLNIIKQVIDEKVKFIINENRDVMKVYLSELYDRKSIESGMTTINFFVPYLALLMDVYSLGRIFKRFERKGRPGELYQEDARNIIIIAGIHHILIYKLVLDQLDFKLVFNSFPDKVRTTDFVQEIELNPQLRCVNADVPFIKEYKLPGFELPKVVPIEKM